MPLGDSMGSRYVQSDSQVSSRGNRVGVVIRCDGSRKAPSGYCRRAPVGGIKIVDGDVVASREFEAFMDRVRKIIDDRGSALQLSSDILRRRSSRSTLSGLGVTWKFREAGRSRTTECSVRSSTVELLPSRGPEGPYAVELARMIGIEHNKNLYKLTPNAVHSSVYFLSVDPNIDGVLPQIGFAMNELLVLTASRFLESLVASEMELVIPSSLLMDLRGEIADGRSRDELGVSEARDVPPFHAGAIHGSWTR